MAAEDPSVSGVSGRYATALFELARDEKSVDAVKADLDKFAALLAESADLARLVRSPVFTADDQRKALGAVLAKAGISGITANLLNVLIANRRLFAVSDVIRAFNALVARFKGEATADVTVAEIVQVGAGAKKNMPLCVLAEVPDEYRGSRGQDRVGDRDFQSQKDRRPTHKGPPSR